MHRGLRFPKGATRSEHRTAKPPPGVFGLSPYHRRLLCEALEDRRLLNATAANPTLQLFSASPALFAENQGQWSDAAVRYVFQGDGASVAMTDAGPVFQVFQQPATNTPAAPSPVDSPLPFDGRGAGGEGMLPASPVPSTTPTQSEQFSVHFDGANLVTPKGTDQAATVYNYLVGDQSQWHSNVPTYQKVAYHGLYSGIDLLTWGQRNSLKYEFHVAPGADYQQIRIHYDGIEGLSVDAQGVLHVQTALGELTDDAPFIYQQIGGRQVAVAGQFKLLDADTYTFTVSGAYDPTRELVIDPQLAWSTYLGSSGDEWGSGIAVDAAGSVYVTGHTSSSDFPTTAGAFDTTYNGYDAFVAKLNPSGTGLVYSTYLGGSYSDEGDTIAVDAAGNAYVTGHTDSSDFPITAGALDRTFGGASEAFVVKLNASGSGLVYSTYLGGSGNDYGYGIAVDAAGDAYVLGNTESRDFPTTAGALDTTFNGGPNAYYDLFVTKLNASGSGLVYSTYLGGANEEDAESIALDAAGNAYLTGYTLSSNFPTTAGALDRTFGGAQDAFVAKLNASGSSLIYSTFLGGSSSYSYDYAFGVAVDAAGNAYVAGSTGSADFPTTTGALDTTFNGGSSWGDAFVAKLNPTGSGLVYSTYLGGSSDDRGYGLALDAAGDAYVTGYTKSSAFPTTAGALDTTLGGTEDAFVAKLNAAGSSLIYSTYLGGSNVDWAPGIAADAVGSVYLIGNTASSDFPTTAGAFDPTYNGGTRDAFVAKLSIPPTITNVLVSSTNWNSTFLSYLASLSSQNVGGYSIPVGGGSQLVTLPWANIDQIKLVFSENVAVDPSDLLLSGVNTTAYNVGGETYNSSTFTATWTLPQAIGLDKLLLQLNADGSSPIVDGSGNRLDGEWTNPTSTAQSSSSAYPSGNGAAGGNFLFRFNVLPSDASQDSTAGLADLNTVLTNYGKSGMAWAQGDFTGDGVVGLADLNSLLTNYGKTLPSGEPTAGSFPASALLLAAPMPTAVSHESTIPVTPVTAVNRPPATAAGSGALNSGAKTATPAAVLLETAWARPLAATIKTVANVSANRSPTAAAAMKAVPTRALASGVENASFLKGKETPIAEPVTWADVTTVLAEQARVHDAVLEEELSVSSTNELSWISDAANAFGGWAGDLDGLTNALDDVLATYDVA